MNTKKPEAEPIKWTEFTEESIIGLVKMTRLAETLAERLHIPVYCAMDIYLRALNAMGHVERNAAVAGLDADLTKHLMAAVSKLIQ